MKMGVRLLKMIFGNEVYRNNSQELRTGHIGIGQLKVEPVTEKLGVKLGLICNDELEFGSWDLKVELSFGEIFKGDDWKGQMERKGKNKESTVKTAENLVGE